MGFWRWESRIEGVTPNRRWLRASSQYAAHKGATHRFLSAIRAIGKDRTVWSHSDGRDLALKGISGASNRQILSASSERPRRARSWPAKALARVHGHLDMCAMH